MNSDCQGTFPRTQVSLHSEVAMENPSESSTDLNREKLEGILNSAVDSIITIDTRGIVESVNPATERIFGYSRAEIVGNNVNMLMPNPDRDLHDTYLSNYVETGIKKIIGIGRTVTGQRKDGSTFPMHLAVSEIALSDGRLFTGIIRDISDLKQAEKDLAEANRQLEQRVKEIELAQDKLVQSERLAAIGQMMAGLAHESRNALQKSHACLSNLALDVQNMPESLELVGKVQFSLDHLHALLEEVRNYAAPIILEKNLSSMVSLVQETWNQIKETNPAANTHQFNIESATDVPERISMDRIRIGQVVRNLLENAVAACGDEPGRVTVELSVDYERNGILVKFSDSGMGIPKENLMQIFEPFFTTKTKGTGLGLAICRRIMDAHRGLIWAENAPAGNAAFYIALPI